MTDTTPHFDTRERLLKAALSHFAEKGFYGTSLQQIASELGLTKQALLYHFKRKEDLYAEVLKEISGRLSGFVRSIKDQEKPASEQLEEIMLGLYDLSLTHPLDAKVLMHELLDNEPRAEKAKDWFLLPFLNDIVATARRINGLEVVPFPNVFSMIYQILGSIQYFNVSAVTLRRMYGDDDYQAFCRSFPDELRGQIQRLVRDLADE